MTQRLLPLILTVIVPYAWADTLYKCTGPDGRITYTNQKTTGKNCEVISQDKPVSTFSPPPRKQRQATPGDFPRVNGDQQKARDAERRAILEKELANEQKNLEAAKKELAEQENLILPEERIVGGGIKGAQREARIQNYRDKVQLHERNIESLQRELANLR
ncbi:DUF4124 domain-containing protein [Sulfuricystis multivorans]|uniref:DUF4124 domain-containing protein n=1 Tax=Sulfuricystis multivorans TaxID=2211108 RepID=UPI000F82D743|nr:DUF4124 domain-containing protein [Sulfuricystis multivorans]